MWTLVGGGMKSLAASGKPMSSVLPSGIEWIKEKAQEIKPSKNTVVVGSGSSKKEIEYDYLVIAVGIQLQYEKVRLSAALILNMQVIVSYSTIIFKYGKNCQNCDRR